MSSLYSSLIHAQNIVGYRVDYDGIAEGMVSQARSATTRGFHNDIKDLKKLLKGIKDSFRYNVALKYLDSITDAPLESPVLDAIKSSAYFWILGNKPGYIIQNLLEASWAWARIPQFLKINYGKTELNRSIEFWRPLDKNYQELLNKARREGIIRPYYGEQLHGEGLVFRLNILGNWSESKSSEWIFGMGLRIARDQRFSGKKAYKTAYQFLLQIGKPYYKLANVPIMVSGKKWAGTARHGFVFFRWIFDWINKMARADAKTWLKTALIWQIMAGMGTMPIPFRRKILRDIGLVDIRKDPKHFTLTEKFIIAGLPGMVGISPQFLAPILYKGLEEAGGILRSWNILTSQITRAMQSYNKYGAIGILGHLPLAGLQFPIYGITRDYYGFIEKKAGKKKVIYKPRTFLEQFITGIGLQPFVVSELYEQRKQKK